MGDYAHNVTQRLYLFVGADLCQVITRSKTDELKLHRTISFSDSSELEGLLKEHSLVSEIFQERLAYFTEENFTLVPSKLKKE
jgi:hypothetical protein